MPITFGSVGDIISVCLLVKDLVDALDKARGSKAEYQSLVRELRILDRALLEIDLLCRTHERGATPELEALCKTAKQAVDRCKELVGGFLTRLKRYQAGFDDSSASTGFVKGAALVIRWRVGEKEALEKFRVEIAGTSSSLHMLLATASVKLIDIKGNQIERRMAALQQNHETAANNQTDALRAVQSRLEDTNRLISSTNAVTNKIADALRLDWIRQLGSELKSLMHRVIAMNIATYHAVISIQSALPNRLERGLIEEPFILEDAIGRVAPVHLQFVTSWEAFHAVLEIRFKDLQGLKKVKEKQYELQDRATQRDIERSRPWQRAFLPGQRVEMSFIFHDDEFGDQKLETVSCPGCHKPSMTPVDSDVQCKNCGMWYRRIMVIDDADNSPQTPKPTLWRTNSVFGKPGFADMILGPARPGRKRVALADVDGEEDIREFKRVRLISKEKRAKNSLFGSKGSRDGLQSFSTLSKELTDPAITRNTKATHQTTPIAELHDESSKDSQSGESLASIIKSELEKARVLGLVSTQRPKSPCLACNKSFDQADGNSQEGWTYPRGGSCSRCRRRQAARGRGSSSTVSVRYERTSHAPDLEAAKCVSSSLFGIDIERIVTYEDYNPCAKPEGITRRTEPKDFTPWGNDPSKGLSETQLNFICGCLHQTAYLFIQNMLKTPLDRRDGAREQPPERETEEDPQASEKRSRRLTITAYLTANLVVLDYKA